MCKQKPGWRGPACLGALVLSSMCRVGDSFLGRLPPMSGMPTYGSSRPLHAYTISEAETVADQAHLSDVVSVIPPPPMPASVDSTTSPVELEEGVIAAKLKKRNAPTVWVEFSALAASIPGGAINLGQGFPNWAPPDFVREAAHAAIDSDNNQYTRTAGHPALVTLLAERYSRHLDRRIDPMAEVAITVGASQALYITLQTLVHPGDDVILLEPFFDLYVGQIRLAGGNPVFVSMLPRPDGGWSVDWATLRKAITPRTRAIILNSPHNPTGKVFTRGEMETLAGIVSEHPRLLVISDEVYKYTVYGEQCEGHIHFASLPGMWDRTLTVSSAGKTFSVTGWQVGWVIGRRELVADIQTALPYLQFCATTPMQEALVSVIQRADLPYQGSATYYHWLAHQFRRKRDMLASALEAAGIKAARADGGFFLLADISTIEIPRKYLEQGTAAMPVMSRDWAFCRWLALEYGIIAIPTSPFFARDRQSATDASNGYGRFVRLTFCKTDETLEAARVALQRFAKDQKALKRRSAPGLAAAGAPASASTTAVSVTPLKTAVAARV